MGNSRRAEVESFLETYLETPEAKQFIRACESMSTDTLRSFVESLREMDGHLVEYAIAKGILRDMDAMTVALKSHYAGAARGVRRYRS